MIVTCDECSTSFQLDESRIPATGARVRCSRCKHAFFLPNPTASASAAVHAIAEEAARDSSARIPSASSDLAGLDGSIASETNPAAPGFDPDEDEWEFTEEVRIEGDDDLDEDLDVDGEFGAGTDFTEGFDPSALSEEIISDGGTTGSGLELDGPDLHVATESAPASEIDEGSSLDLDDSSSNQVDEELATSGIEAGHDDTNFGVVQDFSELTEDLESEPLDTDSGEIPNLREDSSVGLYSARGATDDLGDPESWDLAPGADFKSPKISIAGLVDSFSGAGSESARRPSMADTALEPSYFDSEFDGPSAIKARLAVVGSGVGWLATIAAIAVVGYLSLVPEWKRWESSTQQLAAGAFLAEATHARWVETSRAGTLFVVDGVARNTGRDRIAPANLEVALLDAAGNRLPGDSLSVGTPLAITTLREATPEDLNQAILDSLRQFQSRLLGPGEIRAFQLVLAEVPEDAKRFVLQVNPSTQEPIAPQSGFEPVMEDVIAAGASTDPSMDSSMEAGESGGESAPSLSNQQGQVEGPSGRLP